MITEFEMSTPFGSDMRSNGSAHMDKQLQVAASRRRLRAGGLQR